MPAKRRALREVEESDIPLAKHTETTSTTGDGSPNHGTTDERVDHLKTHVTELYDLLDSSGLTLSMALPFCLSHLSLLPIYNTSFRYFKVEANVID